MSMTTALGNFERWRERHVARRDHDRLEHDTPEIQTDTTDDTTDESPPEPEVDLEAQVDDNNDDNEQDEQGATEDGQQEEEEEETTARVERTSDRITLAELEEERELARRRTSACILVTVFILFRLWIEAIVSGDFGLLMLCLVGTSWTARIIRYNREREEELDRRIQEYTNGDGTREVNRRDLQMLSFQAQLAMAIMESQRATLDGGFGHPDGHGGRDAGVSDQARNVWETFTYKPEASAAGAGSKKKGGYGSVTQNDEEAQVTGKDGDEDELPSCTICLGEYEEGEKLVKLPCDHIYHEECVASWTSNHIRCPLCNFDLESVADDSVTEAST